MAFSFSVTSTATSDASAHTPHGSFPILTQTEAKIINEIVHRSPRNSAQFNKLLEGYQHVLAENNLDVRFDDKYYSLLLKLSLVDGQDWYERWSRVCANQALESNTTQHLLNLPPPSSAELDPDSSTEDGSRTIRAPPNKHPFSPPLASNPPTQAFSTRPLLSRPLQRPVQSTPNRLTRFTPTRIGAIPSLSNDEPSQTRDLNLDSRFVDPLDALSDRTRRQALLKLGFLTWQYKVNRWLNAFDQARKASETLITTNTWRKWRSKVGKRQRQILMVDGVAKTRMKSSTLLFWRRATFEKQKLRRKNHFIQTTQIVQDLTSKNLTTRIFTKWFLLTRLLIAKRIGNRNMKGLAISHWVDRFSRIRQMRALATKYYDQVRLYNLLIGMIVHWKWKLDLKTKEDQINYLSNNHFRIEVFSYWHRMAFSYRLAQEFRIRSCWKTYMQVWKRRKHRLQKLQRRADRIIGVRNQNLLGKAMDLWMVHERGRLLSRILLTRSVTRVLLSWLSRLRRIKDYLNAKHHVFQKKSAKRQRTAVLIKWREVSRHHSFHLPQLAIDRSRIGLIAQHFHRWMVTFSKIQTQSHRSYVNWRLLTMQRTLDFWIQQSRRSRIIKLVNRKRDQMLRQTLYDWVHLTRQKKEDHRTCVTFANKVNPNRKSWALRIWMKRIISLKERKLDVERTHSSHLLSLHFEVWIERIVEIRHFNELANGFLEIQKIELRSRLLELWRRKAVESRKRSTAMAEFNEFRNKQNIQLAFTHWKDKSIERKLKVLEIKTRQAYDYRSKLKSFEIWKNKSRILPALWCDRRRLTTSCWKHWWTLTHVRELRRQALSKDRKLMLSEAFKVWWGKCTAIKASRIVSRFSRPSGLSCGTRRTVRGYLPPPNLTRRHHNESTSNGPSHPSDFPRHTLSQAPTAFRLNRGALPAYELTTSGAESEASSQHSPMDHSVRSVAERAEGATQSDEVQPLDAVRKPDIHRHEDDAEGEYEDQHIDEDRTILGDASEMLAAEASSGMETERRTESEVDEVIRRMDRNRGRRMTISRLMMNQPNGIKEYLPVDGPQTGLLPTSSGAPDSNHDDAHPHNPPSQPRPNPNQILAGLRDFDTKRRNYQSGFILKRFDSQVTLDKSGP